MGSAKAPIVDDAVIKASAWTSARDGLPADNKDRIPVRALIVEEGSHANNQHPPCQLIAMATVQVLDPPGIRAALTRSCAAHSWAAGITGSDV